jgi:hypothetical protein
MRSISILPLVMVGFALCSCADFYSISRRTTLPGPNAKTGVAIHLDAQQRLVMVGRDGKYCAEASPDAMAAYAAALAAGVSVPGYGAGSAANGSQSNIADIGLRTQSITLMRDALYRLCEATANGTVSALSATQLLARSQDLTAVVVAVEQLTGAVAANQSLLTGSSSARASASLISDAAQLDVANKNLVARKAELTQAQTDRDAQQQKVTAQQGKVTDAQTAVTNASTSPPAANLAELQAKLNTETNNLTAEKGRLDVANAKVEAAQKSVDNAQQVVDTIESKNSAAMTDAAASTTGSGQFSSAIVPRVQLDQKATEQIARSVEGMVKEVLQKDYTIDACMTLLTNVTVFKGLEQAQKDNLQLTLKQCTLLLTAKIQNQMAQLHVSAFEPDDSSDRIEKALVADPGLLDKLQDWANIHIPGVALTNFEYGPEYAQARKQAIRDLNIP